MRRTTRTAAVLGLVSGLTLAAGSLVNAGTSTANLSTSAAVANNCTITTSPVAFGSYDPVGVNAATNLDGSGSVTVACTRGTTATIGLDLGSHASGSTRQLSNGSGSFLTYEFYQDSSRSTVWSNSGSGLVSPPAAPSKDGRVFNVYGRVALNQDVTSGTYSDTVTATVNF
jgi:spore coat protein U-like protein